MNESICKGCGANIQWVKTAKGKIMPCNLAKVVIVTKDGKVVSGFTSHFATCPKADKFRGGGK